MAIRGFSQLLSYKDKLVSTIYRKFLIQVLRFIIISICIIYKNFVSIKASQRFVSAINKKSSTFKYKGRKRMREVDSCSVCLAEYEERDELRQLVECRHSFHKHCLDKWLQGDEFRATCPLCRGLVVSEAVLSEYRRVKSGHGDVWYNIS